MKDSEKELINRLNKDYYDETELNRRSMLKQIQKIEEDEIDKIELKFKNTLFEYLLKYKNKKKRIDSMKPFINLKYLDLVREFIDLDSEKISKLTEEKRNIFLGFSEKILSIIPEKSIKNYKESGISNEKHLFFLQIHEALK